MYAIIVGGNAVGLELTKDFLDNGYEVTVIEKDPRRCEVIKEQSGSVVLWGDGTQGAILAEAGADRTDVLVAATSNDQDNLVACQLAKHKFHVPTTVALVTSPANESLFKGLLASGVDQVVNLSALILADMGQKLGANREYRLVEVLHLGVSGLEIVSLRLSSTSPVVGRALGEVTKEILSDMGVVPLAIIRGQRGGLPPEAALLIEADDELLLLSDPSRKELLRQSILGA